MGTKIGSYALQMPKWNEAISNCKARNLAMDLKSLRSAVPYTLSVAYLHNYTLLQSDFFRPLPNPRTLTCEPKPLTLSPKLPNPKILQPM